MRAFGLLLPNHIHQKHKLQTEKRSGKSTLTNKKKPWKRNEKSGCLETHTSIQKVCVRLVYIIWFGCDRFKSRFPWHILSSPCRWVCIFSVPCFDGFPIQCISNRLWYTCETATVRLCHSFLQAHNTFFMTFFLSLVSAIFCSWISDSLSVLRTAPRFGIMSVELMSLESESRNLSCVKKEEMHWATYLPESAIF